MTQLHTTARDSPTALTGLTVLVVEDEHDAREVLACMLEMRGARVHDVPCSAAALAYLAQHTPDLMISDIAMADVDGYSLMQQVRIDQRAPGTNLPNIALTALTSDVDRRRAMDAGFDRHLPKRMQSADLLQCSMELSWQQTGDAMGPGDSL